MGHYFITNSGVCDHIHNKVLIESESGIPRDVKELINEEQSFKEHVTVSVTLTVSHSGEYKFSEWRL